MTKTNPKTSNTSNPHGDAGLMPEVALWTTVVMQAANDLTSIWERGLAKEKEKEKEHRHLSGEDVRLLIATCNWFFDPREEQDFTQVCQYAQMDPEWVRRIVTERMRQIERGWTPDRLRRFTRSGGIIVMEKGAKPMEVA